MKKKWMGSFLSQCWGLFFKCVQLPMKLTVLCMLVLCLHVNARVEAQSITYSKKNVSLSEVFNAIHKETGYEFLYNSEMLKKAHNVDVDFKSVPLNKALKIIFTDQPLTFTTLGKTIIVMEKSSSNHRTVLELTQDGVVGKVTDLATDEPLVGVTVTVKGTTMTTTTDANGRFKISVDQGQTLRFSYVGYNDHEVQVDDDNTIDVKMKQGLALEEIVINTGYDLTTPRKSTTSISSVQSQDLVEQSGSPNVLQALQYKVPGLIMGAPPGSPSSSGRVIIRGIGSINSSTEPLYVVDGIPTEKGIISHINDDDIQDIQVLKGASASALYGNRGSNGVIVINTKKAGYDQELKFNYNTQLGRSEVLPYNLRLMNSKEYLTFERDNDIPGSMGRGRTDAEIEAMAESRNTNWQDYLLRVADINRQSLSLSVGSRNLSAYTSIDYTDQEGLPHSSHFKRFGFNNKLNGRSENGKFHYESSLKLTYTKERSTAGAGSGFTYNSPFMASQISPPQASPYDPDGSVSASGGLVTGDQRIAKAMYTGYGAMSAERYNSTLKDQVHLAPNIQADWEFVDHFTAGVKIGADVYFHKIGNVQEPGFLTAYNRTKLGADYIGADRRTSTLDAHIVTRTRLGYQNAFGSDDQHNLSLDVYSEYVKKHHRTDGFNSNGLDPKFLGDANSFISPEQGLEYLDDLHLSQQDAGLFSYFFIANYDFRDRFGFMGSLRRDGSPRFAKENRWGTFWSLSGRWNIDQEVWMRNSIFDLLKLRIEYGTTGNEAIGGGTFASNYNNMSLYRNLFTSSTGYNNTQAYIVGNVANTNLKWETSYKSNIGVDFSLLKNRIQGTLDVYNEKTVDLFQSRPISIMNGIAAINDNVGSMVNRGIEFGVRYAILNTGDWRLALNGNISYNKNKILDLGENAENGQIINGISSTLIEGESYGGYYAQKYAGVNPANGRALFYDKDGNITEELNPDGKVWLDRPRFPEVFGGFGTSVSFKNFTFSNQWGFEGRVYRRNQDLALMEAKNVFTHYGVAYSLFRAWKAPGDITDIPDIDDPLTNGDYHAHSDRFLENTSYLRLRELKLSYALSDRLLERLPVSYIRLFVQAQNVITFTNAQGYDPVSGNYDGLDFARDPDGRSISIGLNVNF